MKNVILLRYGEIHLKGKNRGFFENALLQNLKNSLEGITCKISRIAGRYLVSEFDEKDKNIITSASFRSNASGCFPFCRNS